MGDKTTHQSFTTRTPVDLYLEIAKQAQSEGVPINRKVNQLLRLGLGKYISLDEALRQMIMDRVTN